MTKAARKRTVSAKKKDQARRKPAPTPEETPQNGWQKLSNGTKALLALIGTTVVATAVPGVLPWVTDHVQDLAGSPIVEIQESFGSTNRGLSIAAGEAVTTEPAITDPRFVPAGFADTRLILEGNRSAKVTVVDATVEVVDRVPARRGTVYFIRPQGETDNTTVELNLDAPRPILTAAGGAPYFTGKHIDVGRGEVWVINVDARATKQEYAWRLHLYLRYRGEDREIVVPAADEPPFRMTAYVKPGEYRQQFVVADNGSIVRHDCATDQAACARTVLPSVQPG
ncbi:hypothetical protein Q0Z83_044980 [Actinoplanes sichuanensis]|uniref:Uncharacterized protein n=1 Tax=Actinoplanes sichuanensis TaxID=512349 RepID=A0ABW4ATV8_9ACTN|nr:hypothetical protein [Actinoplanes sichuanensis]BEL06307.1 hypothetical protein Q0Z83_044980 [Actinoplanes sichuanensis]